MAVMLTQAPASMHRVLPEKADSMIGVGIRKAEKADLLKEIGEALDEARHALRWSLKELTGRIELATGKKRDERQVARWIDGTERQQFDVLFAVDELKPLLLIALARKTSAVEVQTTICIRRSA